MNDIFKVSVFIWDLETLTPYCESCDYILGTGISNLSVDNSGNVSLEAANIPSGAMVYFAAYGVNNKLEELKNVTLTDGKAEASFSVDGIKNIKAFIWNSSTFKPYCVSKSCDVN